MVRWRPGGRSPMMSLGSCSRMELMFKRRPLRPRRCDEPVGRLRSGDLRLRRRRGRQRGVELRLPHRAPSTPTGSRSGLTKWSSASSAAARPRWKPTGAPCSSRDPPAAFFADYRGRVAAAFTDELKAMPQADEVLAKLPLPYCLASSSELGSHPAHPFGDASRRLFRRSHLPCRNGRERQAGARSLPAWPPGR